LTAGSGAGCIRSAAGRRDEVCTGCVPERVPIVRHPRCCAQVEDPCVFTPGMASDGMAHTTKAPFNFYCSVQVSEMPRRFSRHDELTAHKARGAQQIGEHHEDLVFLSPKLGRLKRDRIEDFVLARIAHSRRTSAFALRLLRRKLDRSDTALGQHQTQNPKVSGGSALQMPLQQSRGDEQGEPAWRHAPIAGFRLWMKRVTSESTSPELLR